jgi:integrase/recombinase XerD
VKLTTTEIYTHISIKKLKEIHTATHPSAKLEPPRRSEEIAGDEVGRVIDELPAEAPTEEPDASPQEAPEDAREGERERKPGRDRRAS